MIDKVLQDYRERKLDELDDAIDAIERGYYQDRFAVSEFERIHHPPEPYQNMKGVRIDGVTLYWTIDRFSGAGFYRWVSGIPEITNLRPFLDVIARDERKKQSHRVHRAAQELLVDLMRHHHASITDVEAVALLVLAFSLPRERYYPSESALSRWMFGVGAKFTLPSELKDWAYRDQFLNLLQPEESTDANPSGTQPQSPAPLRGLPGPRQAEEAPYDAPEARRIPIEDEEVVTEVTVRAGETLARHRTENGTIVRLTV